LTNLLNKRTKILLIFVIVVVAISCTACSEASETQPPADEASQSQTHNPLPPVGENTEQDADETPDTPIPTSGPDELVMSSQVYTNSEHGFEITFPQTWVMPESSELIAQNGIDAVVGFFASDDAQNADTAFPARILIRNESVAEWDVWPYNAQRVYFQGDDVIENWPYIAIISDFAEVYLSLIEDVELVDDQNILLDGTPARMIKYAYTNEELIPVIVLRYFYLVGSDMYDISLISSASSFNIYEPVFNTVMESYRVTRRADESYQLEYEWMSLDQITVPSIWSYGMYAHSEINIPITFANGEVSLWTGWVMNASAEAELESYFERGSIPEQFLFDDGIIGDMFFADSGIAWIREDWKTFWIDHGGDVAIFHEYEDLLLRIARSLTVQ